MLITGILTQIPQSDVITGSAISAAYLVIFLGSYLVQGHIWIVLSFFANQGLAHKYTTTPVVNFWRSAVGISS